MGIVEYFKQVGKDPYISVIFIIFVVKLIFILSSISVLILKKVDPKNIFVERLSVIKDKTHVAFSLLVACLIIYLFNPTKNRDAKLDEETKVVLFLYGWIEILGIIKNYLQNK
jgi:hypothetical protein